MRRGLSWLSVVLVLVSAACLGYWAFFYLDGAYHQWKYERVFNERGAVASLGGMSAAGPAETVVARIAIRRLSLSAMVLEGDDEVTLRRAVGHVPGTGVPGRPGNVVLAGHRDTFFRPLRWIRKQDEILLEMADGDTHRYVVDSTRVVAAEDLGVLRPTRTATLTLLTCYPFDFTGPAPARYVVRAKEVPSRNP